MNERKILIIMITLLSGLFFLELTFNFFMAPRLRVTNIVLDTELNIDDKALLNITGLDKSNWYFTLDREELEKTLTNLAVVEDAQVEKQFPNRLKIIIQSREPLVMAMGTGTGEVLPLVIDREGVVFLSGRSVLSHNLPLLGGFDTSVSEAGTRIPDELIPLLEDLDRLRIGSKGLYDIISEINVIPEERGVLDIELYLTTHSIPVLLDLPVTEEKMNQAIMVVDVMEKEGLASRIKEVDLRSGSIVCREREAEGV